MKKLNLFCKTDKETISYFLSINTLHYFVSENILEISIQDDDNNYFNLFFSEKEELIKYASALADCMRDDTDHELDIHCISIQKLTSVVNESMDGESSLGIDCGTFD